MRFLRFVSIGALILLGACAAPYERALTLRNPFGGTERPLDTYSAYDLPAQKNVYRCHVNADFVFKKVHLSGLLIFKQNADKSIRVVFTNEMGYTFFDFGYYFYDSFTVHQIIPQLDKPALIKTLRTDLDLLLGLNRNVRGIYSMADTMYYKTQLLDKFAYHIVDEKTRSLQRIEVADKKVSATIYRLPVSNDNQMPDSISIIHRKAKFTINAKRIPDASAR